MGDEIAAAARAIGEGGIGDFGVALLADTEHDLRIYLSSG